MLRRDAPSVQGSLHATILLVPDEEIREPDGDVWVIGVPREGVHAWTRVCVGLVVCHVHARGSSVALGEVQGRVLLASGTR